MISKFKILQGTCQSHMYFVIMEHFQWSQYSYIEMCQNVDSDAEAVISNGS